MPKFALKYPYFVIMLCLMVMLVGVFNMFRMPVDLFPKIDIPVVVVATFYNGMPPQQIEADITNTFERFFTLGANIDHTESRSLTGVSLIKIYFKPGHGRLAPPAAGHIAPRRAGNGCFEPASLPGHTEG
jgi:multidrug efflux pump subunit AcrB